MCVASLLCPFSAIPSTVHKWPYIYCKRGAEPWMFSPFFTIIFPFKNLFIYSLPYTKFAVEEKIQKRHYCLLNVIVVVCYNIICAFVNDKDTVICLFIYLKYCNTVYVGLDRCYI